MHRFVRVGEFGQMAGKQGMAGQEKRDAVVAASECRLVTYCKKENGAPAF